MHAISRSAALVLGLAVAFGLWSVPHLGARGAAPLPGRTLRSFPPGAVRLYRLTAAQNVLQPIDLHSLADLPAPALSLGPRHALQQGPSVVVTPDGSSYAVVYALSNRHLPSSAKDLMLQLFDARTGRPLSAPHHPAVAVWLAGISADGSTVYGFRDDYDSNLPCDPPSHFYLLNAHTGHLVRQLTVAAAPWDPALVDPSLQRLYTMTTPDHLHYCTAQPPRSYHPTITAYDLRTGREIRAVQLTGVLAGDWYTGQKVNGEGVIAQWSPGIALSPDGSQLAILDGHSDILTLLRARSLHVVATEHLTRPQTALQSIASALGLQPTPAEAKGEENGVELQMQYAADGRTLLVTGSRLLPDRHHLYSSSQPLGIRLVDVATGHLEAWYHDTHQVLEVWPAPDGSAVYSSTQSWTRAHGWSVTLRRHDPSTLRVTALRTFQPVGNWWLNLFFLQSRR